MSVSRRLAGKVALVTGAARGMGRSHALRLAEEGADVVAVDICAPIDTVTLYPLPDADDLAETVRLAESHGGRVLGRQVDVRDLAALTACVDAAAGELGRLDVVVANAGILAFGPATHEFDPRAWQDLLDVNVTGVWNTHRAAAPHLIAAAPGGSEILISSLAGFKGLANVAGYATSKHAIVGLMKVLANEMGAHGIRVNTVHPNTIDTPMVKNDGMFKLFRPDLEAPTVDDAEAAFASLNPMGVPFIDPVHVSNVVVWLASDEARYVSGGQIPVDAGAAVH